MVFCAHCGHPMEEGKKFCNQCGSPMPEPLAAPVNVQTTQILTPAAKTPVAEAPAPVKEASAPVPKEAPAKSQVKEAPLAENSKKKLFPIIFFPALGLLAILLIIAIPRIGRMIRSSSQNSAPDLTYQEPYLEETPAPIPQDSDTTSTLSDEEAMYDNALQLLSEGRYSEAGAIFAELGSYCDSYRLRQTCDFEIAHNYLRENDFDSAKTLLFLAGKEACYDN